MFDSPPEVVPENLTAEEYLYLGKWYEEHRNYDLARSALQRAIETAPGSAIETEAKQYMTQNIPARTVPAPIVERLAKLRADTVTAPRRAVDACRSILAEHPDFDWAHTVLGTALLRTGDIPEAISSLKQAEALNPHRLPNLLSLAEAHMIIMDYRAAQEYLSKVAALLANQVATETPARNHHEQFEQLGRSLQILVAIG